MSEDVYAREFYLKLDRECQKIVDNLYTLLSELKYYEENCDFELPIPIQNLRKNIFNTLKNYEENQS